jgi:hypothetical protein
MCKNKCVLNYCGLFITKQVMVRCSWVFSLAELDGWEDANSITGCGACFGNDSELLFLSMTITHSCEPVTTDKKVFRRMD